jgi:hypothetical protein
MEKPLVCDIVSQRSMCVVTRYGFTKRSFQECKTDTQFTGFVSCALTQQRLYHSNIAKEAIQEKETQCGRQGVFSMKFAAGKLPATGCLRSLMRSEVPVWLIRLVEV